VKTASTSACTDALRSCTRPGSQRPRPHPSHSRRSVPQPAGDGGIAASRLGRLQSRHQQGPLHQPEDRRAPCRAHPRQARNDQPHRRCGLRPDPRTAVLNGAARAGRDAHVVGPESARPVHENVARSCRRHAGCLLLRKPHPRLRPRSRCSATWHMADAKRARSRARARDAQKWMICARHPARAAQFSAAPIRQGD